MRRATLHKHVFWLFLCLVTTGRLSAQISITSMGTPVTENFDAMLGLSATATLTIDQWRAADNAGGTAWAGANRLATTQLGGTAASVSSGGFYNYGNGTATSATDRALGFLSSGTAPWPGTTASPLSIYAQYRNATGETVSQITVNFDYEKYRGGTNAAGWSFHFYYSLDGTTWINVPAGNQTYAADGANSAVSPASTINKAFTITGLSVPANTNFYLRWSYFVSSGTTATNSQGLAIDNVSVSVTGGGAKLPALTATPATISFPLTLLNASSFATYTLTGADLTDDVTITTTAPFSVSTDNTSFSSNVVIPKTDASLAGGKTIYVRYLPTAAGSASGTITNASAGADNKAVALTGTAAGIISLATSPYEQNFDAIDAGLPVGVSVRTGASATSLGVNATYNNMPSNWNNTSGTFKNFASGNNDEGVSQSGATDRALGVRQTGSFGDPGAAFVFQLANTTGKINFTLDFNLQSLDAAVERVATWQVQYGFGLNPTTFFQATATGILTTGGASFANNPVHVDFGNALDNKADVVTIRIVTLTPTTGTGSRPSTAIDDFTINWEDPNAETLSLSTTTLNFDATSITNSRTSSYIIAGQTNLTAPIVLTTAAPFALSVDNTNFSSSLTVDPAEAANKTIYVRFAPTAAGVFSGTVTHSSGAVTKTISLTGEALDPSLLTFNFNTCTTTQLPGSGFLSVNVSGSQTWRCSQFGRNSTNGVDINGFVSSAAQTNDAWLISPALNLNGMTNIPVLSFYSRGEFSGPKLQLYVSTTYSGSGVPHLADWTEITTANFPAPPGSATSVWTLSDNIDLSAYKSAPKLYIAFRYTSGAALGAARWSVDDIAITDQSGLLTVSPIQLSFGEVTAGNQSPSQAITLQTVGGAALSVVPPAGYELSTDNTSFTSGALAITQAEANEGLTLHVRFAPTQKQLKVDGFIRVTAEGLDKNVVSVTGTSYPKAETFDVATYNLSFFGAGSANNFTEQQLATQVANITTVVQRLNMDVIGVQEVSSDVAMSRLVANLPGYAAVLSPRWSYSFDAPDPNFPPQKIGFIYNANTLTLSATEPPRAMFEGLYDSARLNIAGHRLLNYPTGTPSSFWGSGRLPYMATFEAGINGIRKKIRVVVIHAKSGSTASDFSRRLYDNKVLKDSLDYWYGDDEVILLGDYNDRIIRSIYTGSSTSSYLPFVEDAANYTVLTQPLDAAGRTSFPSSNGLIDHITISNELQGDYIANSTDIEDPRAYVSGYNSVSGSDHLPVYARFELQPCPVSAPALISGPATVCAGSTALTYSIEPVATATSYQWTLPEGWTIAGGDGTTSITVNTTATGGQISVVAKNGCGTSQPAAITIAVTTTNAGTVTPSKPVICSGTAVTLTVTGHTGTIEKWQSSEDGSSWTDLTATTPSYTAINLIRTTYFRVVANNGCGAVESAATEVVVNSPVLATVPDVFAVAKGGAANTLYLGYGPSSFTLEAAVSGGTAPYSYKWTIGSSAGQGVQTPKYTVSPQGRTTYYMNVKDAYGCSAAVVTKTVNVVDVRCGPKLDKVTICQTSKGKTSTTCVAQKDVASALAGGATLGSCPVNAATTRTAQPLEETLTGETFQLTGWPNPATNQFNLQVRSADRHTPVQVRAVDLLGRTVELRNNVVPNSNLQLGSGYKAGVYLIEVVQGAERRQLKLIKK